MGGYTYTDININLVKGLMHLFWDSEDKDEANGKDRAYISAFRIDEGYRGQGLGKKLMLRALDRIKERGYTEVTIGVEHDDSDLPIKDFTADENNPTYILLDDLDKIVGVASLMLTTEFRSAKKARFRVFHSILNETEAYKIMLDEIIKHTNGIDFLYMFIPEERETTAKILNKLDFKISRYSFYMERNLKEYIKPDFPEGFELRTFRKGIDETAWCNIINECFAALAGHTDSTPETIAQMDQDEEYIEGGMMMLWKKEEPVGTICVSNDEEENGRVAFIGCVSISPKFRGMGLGKNLIRAAIEFGKDNGLENAALSVNGENQNAVKLYLGEGFEKKISMVCHNLDLI